MLLQLHLCVKRCEKGCSPVTFTVVISGGFGLTFNLILIETLLYCLTFYSKHVIFFVPGGKKVSKANLSITPLKKISGLSSPSHLYDFTLSSNDFTDKSSAS